MAKIFDRLFSSTALTREKVKPQPLVLTEGAIAERPAAKALAEEIATASMTGVRQAWSTASAVSGLTPDRLGGILRAADRGDLDALFTLAEEMEERDPHYASVLSTRKLAVQGLERQLSWAKGDEDHPQADEIMEKCAKLVAGAEFDELLGSILDALAKPYSVTEIIWSTTSTEWKPVRYEHRDGRWFQLDRETGREVRLKDPGAIDGVPLPPFKFVVGVSSRKQGLPARAGLARLVAFSFVCKLYGVKDWMAYAEIFGIPLRLGKYGAGASADDVEVLKRAVFGLGSDAAAVIPEGMTIEFPTVGSTSAAELFKILAEFFNNEISKAVLGQTGSADMQKGGGYAQAAVQDEVRVDLKKADAVWVGSTVKRDILEPYVRFNYGPDAPVPNLDLVIEENEDLTVLAGALEKLVPLGLKVGQAQLYKRMKLTPPAADEELLTPPQATPVQAPPAARGGDQNAQTKALAREQVTAVFAEARARRQVAEAQLDEVQIAALDGWEKTWGGEVAAIIDLVERSESYEGFVAGLTAMAADLATPAPARSLASAMFQAAVIGGAQGRKKGA